MNILFFYYLLLVIIFILSGVDKIWNIKSNAKNLFETVKLNLPMSLFITAIILVIIIEIGCSFVILYSSITNKYNSACYYSAVLLIGFTIMATLLYHFPPKKQNYYNFLKNLSILGGLFLVVNNTKI
jgi:hypothetical protein